MSKKKIDQNIVNWLEIELEYAESDLEEAEHRAEEFKNALDRYKRTGSLPRDIVKEYKEYEEE